MSNIKRVRYESVILTNNFHLVTIGGTEHYIPSDQVRSCEDHVIAAPDVWLDGVSVEAFVEE